MAKLTSLMVAALALVVGCSLPVAPPDGGEGEGEPAEGEGEPGEGEGEPGEGEGEGDPPPGARTPPPLPSYSHGACPSLVGGNTSETSVVTGFATGDQVRKFRLLVPANYDASQPYALMFAWHWLNAESDSFVSQGELETAIEQFPFIIVAPDKRLNDDGSKAYQFDWPFVETSSAESELVFFDDLLACVNASFNIDRERVYGIGVSAGALWVTFVSTTDRANHFAAIESLSGGLGSVAYGGSGWSMQYAPQPNKFPAIVLWGGADDWLGLSFHDASVRYRDALRGDGHFVVECVHDAGHAVPPIEAPPGVTRFAFLWQFMLDHPMSVAGGASPWSAGLPASAPTWCSLP